MKTLSTLAFMAGISCAALAQSASPAPAPVPATPAVAATRQPAPPAVPLRPGPATVTTVNLQVRGQGRLESERLTQLNQADSVIVLEEIVLQKPAPGEPARWARIALPTDVKVWVNSLFLDLTNKTVLPNRLNVRSGPGEHYSILGVVEKGEQLHEAGLTNGDWIQIEAPTNTYAFVAAEYLKQDAALLAAVAPPQSPARPPVPAREPTPAPEPTPVPATVPTPVAEPPPIAPAVTNVPAPAPAEPASFAAAQSAKRPAADAASIEKAREAMRRKMAELTAEEAGAGGEPTPPRIVSHEGVVRTTMNIQSPTKYVLVDPASGKLVNYLYTTSTNLNLREYKGRRIIVTGEEGLDKRWENTPVITIERIRVLE